MTVGAGDALGGANDVAAALADDAPLLETPTLAHPELDDDTVRAATVAEARNDAELEVVARLDPVWSAGETEAMTEGVLESKLDTEDPAERVAAGVRDADGLLDTLPDTEAESESTPDALAGATEGLPDELPAALAETSSDAVSIAVTAADCDALAVALWL